MPRSLWKGFFCDIDVAAGVRALQMAGGAKVQGPPMKIMSRSDDNTHTRDGQRSPAQPDRSRSSAILPEFLGYRFEVHNGKKFYPIEVKIGKKFGEFAPTRTYPKHPEKVTLGTGPPKK